MEDWSYYFNYDPETGKLYWRVSTSWRVTVGDEAGSVHPNMGYVIVGLKCRHFVAHRIIWEMHNGPIPKGMQVDHINHIRYDNRLCNLRLVTQADNHKNMTRQSNNVSKIPGVYWDATRGKWHAQIKYQRKVYALGRFDDFFETCCARKSKELEFGFHPNHGRNTEGVEK